MDYTAEELEDLATMRELRARLRACADARVAACLAMPHATIWLEIYRQMRAIEATDRMLVRLYSPPTRRRKRTSPPHASNGFSVPTDVPARLMKKIKPADAADLTAESLALKRTSVPEAVPECSQASSPTQSTRADVASTPSEPGAAATPAPVMNRQMRRRAQALGRRTQTGP